MKSRIEFAGTLACMLVAAFAAGSAELYRCPTSDGKIVYTDREDACPGAVSHTISAEVQRYEPAPAAVAPTPAPEPQKEKLQSGVWAEKKRRSEQELNALQEKWDYLNQYITHCNRHGKVLSANAAGLPYEVSCKNIREEYARVKTRLAEVRLYLDETLEEECRRAGCMPGWIR